MPEVHVHFSALPGECGTGAVSQEGPFQSVRLGGVPRGALHDPSGLPVLCHAGEGGP